jgi:hypothetical protein
LQLGHCINWLLKLCEQRERHADINQQMLKLGQVRASLLTRQLVEDKKRLMTNQLAKQKECEKQCEEAKNVSECGGLIKESLTDLTSLQEEAALADSSVDVLTNKFVTILKKCKVAKMIAEALHVHVNAPSSGPTELDFEGCLSSPSLRTCQTDSHGHGGSYTRNNVVRASILESKAPPKHSLVHRKESKQNPPPDSRVVSNQNPNLDSKPNLNSDSNSDSGPRPNPSPDSRRDPCDGHDCGPDLPADSTPGRNSNSDANAILGDFDLPNDSCEGRAARPAPVGCYPKRELASEDEHNNMRTDTKEKPTEPTEPGRRLVYIPAMIDDRTDHKPKKSFCMCGCV